MLIDSTSVVQWLFLRYLNTYTIDMYARLNNLYSVFSLFFPYRIPKLLVWKPDTSSVHLELVFINKCYYYPQTTTRSIVSINLSDAQNDRHINDEPPFYCLRYRGYGDGRIKGRPSELSTIPPVDFSNIILFDHQTTQHFEYALFVVMELRLGKSPPNMTFFAQTEVGLGGERKSKKTWIKKDKNVDRC